MYILIHKSAPSQPQTRPPFPPPGPLPVRACVRAGARACACVCARVYRPPVALRPPARRAVRSRAHAAHGTPACIKPHPTRRRPVLLCRGGGPVAGPPSRPVCRRLRHGRCCGSGVDNRRRDQRPQNKRVFRKAASNFGPLQWVSFPSGGNEFLIRGGGGGADSTLTCDRGLACAHVSIGKDESSTQYVSNAGDHLYSM